MRIVAIVITLMCLSCITDAKEKKAVLDSKKTTVSKLADTYFSKLTELGDFNGVVLLKKGEETVLKKAYNMSSDEDSTLYVSKHSQFDLRSIAKLFAKLSIVQLEKEGKLSTSDTLAQFLPDFPNAEKITLHHLMTNSSGLPRSFEDSQTPLIDLSPEEVVTLAAKSDLEFEPGEKELYSNVGFQLLYFIIGQVTNSSFEEFIDQRFFQPLGMMNSGSNFYKGNNRKQHYAYGHYLEDEEIVCDCSFPDDDMKMGHLFSTIEDLNKLLLNLDPTIYKEVMHDGIISHAGGSRGKRAYVERNFKEDYSFVFLSNFDQIPFEQIIRDTRLILEGKKVEMPEAVNRKSMRLPVTTLKKYVGTYDLVDAGHIVLDIKLISDSLFVFQKGKNNGAIVPESQTVFFSDSTSKESIEFVENGNGSYDMLIDFQGVQWKGENVTRNK